MFIGRKKETKMLQRETSGYRFNLIEISGDSGIGKTSLIENFYEQNEKSFAFCAVQMNPAQVQNSAIGSLVLQIANHVSEEEIKQIIPPNNLQLWSSLCPELLKKHSSTPTVLSIKKNGYDLDSKIEIFYEIITRFQAIVLKPLVIWIDDFQYLDTESLMIFEKLIPLLERRRLSISWIVSYRFIEGIPFAERWAQIKSEVKQKKKMMMKPFSIEETKAFADMFFSSEFSAQNSKFLNLIQEKTQGNPFFIRQILQQCRDSDVIECQFDRWVVHEKKDKTIERALRELLTSRLADFIRSSTVARYVFYYLQVANQPISDRALIGCHLEQRDAIQDALFHLLRAGIAQRKTENGGRVQYFFSHSLWCETEIDVLKNNEKTAFLREIIPHFQRKAPDEIPQMVQFMIALFQTTKKPSQQTKKMLRDMAIRLRKEGKIQSLIPVYDLLLMGEKSKITIARNRYEQILVFEQIGDIPNIVKLGSDLDFHLLSKAKRRYFFHIYIRMFEKSPQKQAVLSRYKNLLASPHLEIEERIEILFEKTRFLLSAEELDQAERALHAINQMKHGNPYFKIKASIFQKTIKVHLGNDLIKTLSELESLFNEHKKELNREDLFYFSLVLMNHYQNSNQPEKALQYGKLRQKNILKPQSKTEEVFVQYNQALLFVNAGKFREGAEILEKVLPYYESIRLEPNYCSSATALGMCYIYLGKYSESIQVLEHALPHYRESDIPDQYFFGLNNLSGVYLMTYQSSKALRVLEELKSKPHVLDELRQYFVEHNSGLARMEFVQDKKQIRKAIEHFTKAKDYLVQQKMPEAEIVHRQILIAAAHCFLHEIQKANLLYREIVGKFPIKTLLVETDDQKEFVLNLAALAILLNKKDDAESLCKNIEPINEPLLISRVQMAMALFAERITGDRAEASDWILKSAISGVEVGQVGLPRYLQSLFPWFSLQEALQTEDADTVLQWAKFITNQYQNMDEEWQFFHLCLTEQEFANFARKEILRLERVAQKLSSDLQEEIMEIIKPLSVDLPNEKIQKRLDVRCFGQFEVCYDGKPIPNSHWKSRQGQKILAYLVDRLAQNKTHIAKEALFADLWPDRGNLKKISASFRVILSRLRKQIAKITPDTEWIVRTNGGFALNSEMSVQVDCIEFSKYIAAGKAAQLSGNTFRALNRYESAIHLYQGAYLWNLADDWNESNRIQFADEFEIAVEFVIEYYNSIEDKAMRHRYEQILKDRLR